MSFFEIMELIFIPLSTPQSLSTTMTSCETSTNLLVRYPDSAVFNAVSVEPFLAPWVEIKNSETVRPSLNEALTHAGLDFSAEVNVVHIDSELLEKDIGLLKNNRYDGILIPG